MFEKHQRPHVVANSLIFGQPHPLIIIWQRWIGFLFCYFFFWFLLVYSFGEKRKKEKKEKERTWPSLSHHSPNHECMNESDTDTALILTGWACLDYPKH